MTNPDPSSSTFSTAFPPRSTTLPVLHDPTRPSPLPHHPDPLVARPTASSTITTTTNTTTTTISLDSDTAPRSGAGSRAGHGTVAQRQPPLTPDDELALRRARAVFVRGRDAEGRDDLQMAFQMYFEVVNACAKVLPRLPPGISLEAFDLMRHAKRRIEELRTELFEASFAEESDDASGASPSDAASDCSDEENRMWFGGGVEPRADDDQGRSVAQSTSSAVTCATEDDLENQHPKLPEFSLQTAPGRPVGDTTHAVAPRVRNAQSKAREHELELLVSTITMGGTVTGASPKHLISNLLTTCGVRLMEGYVRLEPLTPDKKERYMSTIRTCLRPVEDVKTLRASDSASLNSIRLREIHFDRLRALERRMLVVLDSFEELQPYVDWTKDWPDSRETETWRPVARDPGIRIPQDLVDYLRTVQAEIREIRQRCILINKVAVDAMAVSEDYLNELPRFFWQIVPFDLNMAFRSSENVDIVGHIRKQQSHHTDEYRAKKMASDLDRYLLLWNKKFGEKSARHDKAETARRSAMNALATIRRTWPTMGCTKVEEHKIASNTDVILSYLEAYSRMLEGVANKMDRRLTESLEEIDRL